jgi:hypothetical protein
MLIKTVETMFPAVKYEIIQTGQNKYTLFRNKKLVAVRSEIKILEVMLSELIK